MSQALLSGQEYVEDDSSQELSRLRDQIAQLKDELEVAQLEARNAKSQAARAVSALRQQLTPLYRGLQNLFGELDRIEPAAPDAVAPAANGANPRWEALKRRFPGKPAEIIDAILELGPLNTTQLAAALRCNRQVIPNHIHTLNKAGAIVKNGGVFSLK